MSSNSDPAVLAELDRIAERVATLVRALAQLRDENQALRVAVDQRDGENKVLRERLDSARLRVETLIARLPGEPEEA